SGRIVSLFDTMLVPQGEGSGTPTEPHHTPSLEAHQTSPTTYSLPTLPPSSALPPVAYDPASPLRDVSQEMVSMLEAQELEINSLKARIKLLEDKDRGVTEHSGDDAPIKGRNLDEGE
nr:hypothetical protein [Tanacetum cinerariifolium]